MKIFAKRMMKFIMRPTRMKSLNLYPPGTYTRVWVGEPIGVAKLELADIIRATQKVSGLTPRAVAADMAIG